MIPTITDTNVFNVKRAFDIYTETPLTKTRATTAYLDTLSPTELWLLSFVYYIKERNKRWLGVDFSLYYSVPVCKKQTSTFRDFLTLLSVYSLKRITAANEKELVLFLAGCTRELQEFYEILMSKTSTALFNSKEIRGYLDLSAVKAEEIYGSGVLVTTVPSPLPMGLIRQELGKKSVVTSRLTPKRGGGFSRKALTGTFKLDAKMIHTTEYVLLGLLDEEKEQFYPIDYFDSYKEYVKFSERHKSTVPYEKRLAKLNSFLDKNYLRQIQKVPKVYCIAGSHIANVAAEVLRDSPHSTVVICDGKEGVRFKQTLELQGVTDSLWLGDAGEVIGLKVWNMGRLINCTFDFSGDNHALIYNPQLLLKKYVRFHLFSDGEEAGAVKEILFDKKLFMEEKYSFKDGTVGHIECCVFCLQDHRKYAHNGLCDSTLKCWFSSMSAYGVDKWFPVSYAIRHRRKSMGWRPEFFNNVIAVFRGYKVVVDGDRMMFQTDAESKAIYDWRVAALTRDGRMPEIKHETPEDLHQMYLKIEANKKLKREQKKHDLLFGNRPVEA